jgi:hypothetical protein
MRIAGRTGVIILAVLLFAVPLLTVWGCDGNGEKTDGPLAQPEGSGTVKITIGNLSDLTGVAANPLAVINMALDDVIAYYNEENLIPGVELKVIKYDTQFDPSRFVTGYEWVRERGADMIWNALPPGVTTLKSRANNDKFPIFTATASIEREELAGGYMYCLAIAPTNEAYTFLKWLAENDPDFPQDRPARIGGVAWSDAYSNIWFRAAREYCKAHPDQYTWVKDYLTDIKFMWGNEVEGLKDCDYVYLPTPPQAFAKEYRNAGHEATFIMTEVAGAFFSMIDKGDLWGTIDGTMMILSSGWYNEDGSIVDLTNKLLDEKHPGQEGEDIRNNGVGYRAVKQAYMMCEIIRETVERVGAENFGSEALVNTANSWSFEYKGIEDFNNFTETKRFSQNYYGIYEIVVPENDESGSSWQYITRIDPEWIPEVTAP